MNYHIFRELADSWVLLAMFGFFMSAVLLTFRPGSRARHKDIAGIPFRHENEPAPIHNEDQSPAVEEAKS
jgi:cytochrome c oxidase cbb3-type subunit 4